MTTAPPRKDPPVSVKELTNAPFRFDVIVGASAAFSERMENFFFFMVMLWSATKRSTVFVVVLLSLIRCYDVVVREGYDVID
jgi:hypothetical protein